MEGCRWLVFPCAFIYSIELNCDFVVFIGLYILYTHMIYILEDDVLFKNYT